ncbi:hypothetical protein ACO0LG_06170 [Undibacterium sp. Ji42W]|uniref:hypothetical protein n=1 Tax=Undibacterium sp. Ji42W TaxID=3413039 RepID=UPI003BF03EB0
MTGGAHAKAITLADAVLWDPSGQGCPMKEWVALSATYGKKSPTLAQAAFEYMQSLI